MPARTAIRHLAGLVLAGALLLLLALPAIGAQSEISSAGPLTRIIVGDELNCQVAHRDDSQLELYGGELGACGTFLAVEGTLFGPREIPAGISPTQGWTPVSQSAVTGLGTAGDPFRIVTVVAAGASGLRIEQTDSYVIGQEAYRTDIRLINEGAAGRSGILYRAGDCYLQESDVGYGRVDNGAPACITEQTAGSRIEQWLPLTPGSSHMEGEYDLVWAHVASQQPFPNTCRCDARVDNGAGLSWTVSVGAGESVVISHETFFSPLGRTPVSAQGSFRESLPAPTEISFDPIVVLQSLVITAAVLLLMPFPAALFNETLEANYDRVAAGVARLRAAVWGAIHSIGGAVAGAVGRAMKSRRRPPAAGPAVDGAAGSEAPPLAETRPAPPPLAETRPAPPPLAEIRPAPPPLAETRPTLRRWTPPDRGFWRSPQGVLLFILPSALVYSFLDPAFGLSLESLATLAGLVIGLALVIAAYGIPLLAFARLRRIDVVVEALPVTLLIGVGCVLLSRFADFQPGYIYGLVIGALFARGTSDEKQGPAEAVGAATLLVVAIAAWVSLLVLRGPAAGDDLAGLAFETAAVTTAVAGVEGVLFAMLPLAFMPGGAVFAWNRRIWAVLVGIGVFGFAHVLLNPLAGYLGETTRASFLTMLAVFIGFGLVSVLFWAWFRFRPAPGPVAG